MAFIMRFIDESAIPATGEQIYSHTALFSLYLYLSKIDYPENQNLPTKLYKTELIFFTSL